jgi:hypothetical protein
MAGQKLVFALDVPAIHVFACAKHKDVDARHRRQVYAVCAKQTAVAGHDEINIPCVVGPSRQRPRQQTLDIAVGEIDGAVHAGVIAGKPRPGEQLR